MMNLNRALLILVLCVSGPAIRAQGVSGTWQTIDDQNGQPKAIVEITVDDGRLYGTIIKIVVDGQEDARCTACSGQRAGKPIVGMRIINGLRKAGENSWKGDGDSLFDPEQGRSFRSRIWLDDQNPDLLKVRGYWMLFYRTQTWKRVSATM